MDHAEIDAGMVSMNALVEHGRDLFVAQWNSLDGRGRPFALGNFMPRADPGPGFEFTRIVAPDASSCAGCHNAPVIGGAAGFAANAFLAAGFLDPVVTDVTDRPHHLERGSMSVMGLGPLEVAAREMSAELGAQRDIALAQAAQRGLAMSMALSAKGVGFGSLIAYPDGRIDPTGIEGVDHDLVVKPFLRTGFLADLRFFTNIAFNDWNWPTQIKRPQIQNLSIWTSWPSTPTWCSSPREPSAF